MKTRIDDIVFDDGHEAARVLTDAGFRVESTGERAGFVFPAVLPANYPEAQVGGAPLSLAEIEEDGNVMLCDTKDALARGYHVRIAEVMSARDKDRTATPACDAQLDVSHERTQALASWCREVHIRILAHTEGESYFLLGDLSKNFGGTLLLDVKLDELLEVELIEVLGRIPIRAPSIKPKSGRYLYRLTQLGAAVLQASADVEIDERGTSHPYR